MQALVSYPRPRHTCHPLLAINQVGTKEVKPPPTHPTEQRIPALPVVHSTWRLWPNLGFNFTVDGHSEGAGLVFYKLGHWTEQHSE